MAEPILFLNSGRRALFINNMGSVHMFYVSPCFPVCTMFSMFSQNLYLLQLLFRRISESVDDKENDQGHEKE